MSRKETEKTLVQWLIEHTDGEAYRAGRLTGQRHPKVDQKLLTAVGGLAKLIEQAKALEQDPLIGKTGKISFGWRDMGGDISKIDYDISIIPQLCRRDGIADPREKQLQHIARTEDWRAQAADCRWLLCCYDDLLARLEQGKVVPEAEDELFFKGLNAVARQKDFVWERIFSASVFPNSKVFANGGYKMRIFNILKDYSPHYEEGMSMDEFYAAHNIHSYTQTLEWKGPLQYLIDGELLVDTSLLRYGEVLNAQTMEHALPAALGGCKKIMVIENKANYENMTYDADTLYIYCHGFFSPKEVKFLKKMSELAEPECVFLHWGDMDYGGIRIFQFIKKNVFPKLHPYKMSTSDFVNAVEAGAGIPLRPETREKLRKMDAGELEELKDIILQRDLTIEQEVLV